MKAKSESDTILATSLARQIYRLDDLADVIDCCGRSPLVAGGKRAPAGDLPQEPASLASRHGKVGIWRSVETPSGRQFLREPVPEAYSRHWADVAQIARKTTRPRVVLVGASVARGALCEPHICPASALRALATRNFGANAIEVVDLARTALMLDQAFDLMDASLQLEPDGIVLFAGNNWHEALEHFRNFCRRFRTLGTMPLRCRG
jgi:hypothetical protein